MPGVAAFLFAARRCRANTGALGQWARWSSTAQGSTESPTAAYSRALLANSKISKLLVANRGEIACRIITTARKLGVRTVAVYSEVDKDSQHVKLADEAYCIGAAPARESYLKGETLLQVAKRAGAQAIHPGYGFLSENAAFAEACAQAGVEFVGPTGSAIRSMGNKAEAKSTMSAAGVPVVPGYHDGPQDDASLLAAARDIGFPLLVKAVSGGGGKGMKLAHSMEELPEALASARREAAASFGDDRLLMERYIQRPRHVEVQVIADKHGNAVYLFDRDCSVQRRHQKIIEEAPAPGLPGSFHSQIGEAAVKAAQAVGYHNAGTVEFIVDVDSPGAGSFYFMEMNTRLQVEHPVSEAVANVDLVELQLVVAAGGKLPLTQQQVFQGDQVGGFGPAGHSFEARVYAESPKNNFLPGAGTVRRWRPPPGAFTFEQPFTLAAADPATRPAPPAGSSPAGAGGKLSDVMPANAYIRVDSGVQEGDSVGTNYDPMIAKIISWAPDRNSALQALRYALANTQVAGLPTNMSYLRRLAAHPAFIDCELDTAFVKRHADVLLAPQTLTPTVVAVAAVARHLLEVASAAAVRPGGAWGVPDSKRLWHHPTFRFKDMSVPEAGVTAAAAAGAGSQEPGGSSGHKHSTEQQGLNVSVSVKSATDFDVRVKGLPGVVQHSGEPGYLHHVHVEGEAEPAYGHLLVKGARLIGTDRFEAEVGHKRVQASLVQYVHGSEQLLCLWLDGEQYEFRWPLPKWSKDVNSVTSHHAAGDDVKAPMPGRVVKLLVADGDKVSRGAQLVVIEAMKMEHSVVATKSGRITGLSVAPGVQVSDGQVLLSIADDKDELKKAK